MLAIALLCALLLQGTSALCVGGPDGADGTGGTISKTTKAGGCYTKTYSLFPSMPMHICDGKNGANGQAATITMLNQSLAGCALFKAPLNAGQAILCNGTQGTTGVVGDVGPQGPPGITYLPTITTANLPLGCQLITANGSAVLCNGTAGPRGNNGTAGDTGLTGANGTTGATGAQGNPGAVYPNVVVVDGVSGPSGAPYSYTAAGIKRALCDVGCGSGDCLTCNGHNGLGGIVRVGQKCQFLSSGTSCAAFQGTVLFGSYCCTQGQQIITLQANDVIRIPSGVTLDLGGNILQVAASSTSSPIAFTYYTGSDIGLVASTGVMVAAANSSEGATTITIASSNIISTGLAAGQMCLLGHQYVDGSPASAVGGMMVEVVSFTNSSGVIVIRPPLIGAWGVPADASLKGTIQCYQATSMVVNAGLQNGVLMANAGATGTSVNMVQVNGASGITVQDIQFTGAFTSLSTNQAALQAFRAIDCDFQRLEFVDYGIGFGIYALSVSTSVFREVTIRSSSLNAGLELSSVNHNIFDGIFMSDSTDDGVLAITSSYNVFRDVTIIKSATGTGIGFALSGKSRNNNINGLAVSGSTSFPVQVAGAGDSYNQFRGLSIRNNGGNGIRIGSGAVGNYFDGDMDVAPTSNANSGTGNTGTDLFALNNIRSPINAHGFTRYTVHNATMASGDFAQARMVAFTISGLQADSNLVIWMKDSTSTVKSATQALS